MATELVSPMAVPVEEAARRLNISRSLAWELVWAGKLRSVRLGRRVLVPVKALENILDLETGHESPEST